MSRRADSEQRRHHTTGRPRPDPEFSGIDIARPTCDDGARVRYRKVTALPEQPGAPTGDSRRPTAHEQLSGAPWDASYSEGPAPWDIGHPQKAVVRVASDGGFTGTVLDAGCGTGENALYLAALGLPVVGFDVAETALALAREKTAERGLDAEFVAADALALEGLPRRFDTVLDCGLFHTLARAERHPYVSGLASVTAPGATLYVLCFSDEGTELGPHPVSTADLNDAFGPSIGWNIATVEPERIETRFHDHGAPAWLARIDRVPAAVRRP